MMFRSLARYKITSMVGVMLLGIIFGVGGSGNIAPTPHHPGSRPACQLSILSCLTRKLSDSATSTTGAPAHVTTSSVPHSPLTHAQPSTSSSTQILGASALGPLQGNLSAVNAQIILDALAQLPASTRNQITSRLGALTASDAAILGDDIAQVFASLKGDAQSYADALVGVGGFGSSVLSATTGELNAISGLFLPLPSALSGGSNQISLFVSEALSTTVPYIESLLNNAISQVPQAVGPLVLAATYRILAQNTPTDLGNIVALLMDAKALALLHADAYQAELDCNSAQHGKCTAYDRFIISIASVRTAPGQVQQDFVDCGLAPLCTPAQSQAIISWVEEAPASASLTASVKALSAIMQANSYTAAIPWLDAF